MTQTEDKASQRLAGPASASLSHRIHRNLEKLEQEYRHDEGADGIKKYVEEVERFCDAEIEAGRMVDSPRFWAAIYSHLLVSVKGRSSSLVGSRVFTLLRTGGGRPGEQAEVEELRRELSRVAAEIERKLANALEHVERAQLTVQPHHLLATFPTEPSPPPVVVPPRLESALKKPTNEREPRVMPLLNERGMSINDWAVQSGVDFHTANRYLKGLSNPYQSTRNKLAKSLGIKVEDLPL